ncbi:MAG: DNA integrity scanning protein DisA nucleotide-binding domain protein, partial [Oscillospiraceae bacterium]|nr:DNA integrity scanning protein DisA nucleotide-binding domain protein [Oscillospiraceae bacterium]
RKLLEQMGSKGILDIFGKQKKTETLENCITQTVLACAAMSEARIGALIVFERGIHLDDRIQTGTVLDAEPTSELYKTVFFPKTSLHDGACIIRNGRIVAAGCVLPTSNSQNISKELGMRHRAAIGMSAESDAVCVVVSEETGSISVAVGGMLKRHLAVDTFDKLLRNELITETKKKTISDITDFNDVINLLKEKLNVQRKSK